MKYSLEYIATCTDVYGIENLWQEDLSDAIASGDIPKLEEAYQEGWDVNLPLIKFYSKEYQGLERAEVEG